MSGHPVEVRIRPNTGVKIVGTVCGGFFLLVVLAALFAGQFHVAVFNTALGLVFLGTAWGYSVAIDARAVEAKFFGIRRRIPIDEVESWMWTARVSMGFIGVVWKGRSRSITVNGFIFTRKGMQALGKALEMRLGPAGPDTNHRPVSPTSK